MTPTDSYTKDPTANLDYGRDWSDWLDEVDDTIASSAWTISPDPGLVVGTGGKAPSFTDKKTTIWLAGGAVGNKFLVSNAIVTVGGRTDERTFEIVVRNR